MQSNADYAEWFRGRPKRLEMSLNASRLTKVNPKVLADLGCETPRIYYDMHNGTYCFNIVSYLRNIIFISCS